MGMLQQWPLSGDPSGGFPFWRSRSLHRPIRVEPVSSPFVLFMLKEAISKAVVKGERSSRVAQK
jgi:hypothetical protein